MATKTLVIALTALTGAGLLTSYVIAAKQQTSGPIIQSTTSAEFISRNQQYGVEASFSFLTKMPAGTTSMTIVVDNVSDPHPKMEKMIQPHIASFTVDGVEYLNMGPKRTGPLVGTIDAETLATFGGQTRDYALTVWDKDGKIVLGTGLDSAYIP